MSGTAALLSHGAPALAITTHGSRPLRSHDLENSSHRARRRSPSPNAINANTTTHKRPVSADSAHSTDETSDVDAGENADDDEDDDKSGATHADGKEPEVQAPLHSFGLDGTPTTFSRAQAATAGLQHALESAADQQRGAGPHHDSLIDPADSLPARKRSFSQLTSTARQGNNSSQTMDHDEPHRKKVHREPGSNNSAPDVSNDHNENTDEDDDNYDADIEILQRATKCDEDDAFIDDDDYDGLNAVSDTDEGHGVRRIETLNIQAATADDSDSEIDSDFGTPRGPLKLNTIFDVFGSEFHGMEDVDNPNNLSLFSQQDDLLDDLMPTSHRRNESDGSARKVRFEDEVHGSSQASSTGSSEIRNEFPDILLSQDRLDAPPFPRGPVGINSSSRGHLSPGGSDGSYWDYTDGYFQPENVHMSDSSESSPGSSGYESENSYISEGETTDDELFVPTTISRPDSLLHEPSTPSKQRRRAVRRLSDSPSSQRSDTVSPGRSYPKLPPRGTFRVNIHHRVSMTDWTGTKTLMYNMGDPKCTCNSERNCINGKPKEAAHAVVPILQTPNTPAESMNMAFNNLVDDTPIDTFQSEVLGPFEAFFPFYNVEADGTVSQDQLDLYEDDDVDLDESEMDLDIDNFITYSSDESEDEDMEGAPALQSPTTSDQEHTESDHATGQDNWFQSYDSNTITSFRRNHDRAQEVSRMPEHPILRNSDHLANAYRQGRAAAADSLITPPRRRRGNRSMNSVMLQL
ncbi:MAG: hypothetical protein M1821_009445 [Bathelium mastoideum]|nr:MAG: hypothetical protein M1821_009445 [Bathelium mastoideum]KAI9688663.1 MAG: hypothetical protein M1822_001020 [Bathelium mastoideum]